MTDTPTTLTAQELEELKQLLPRFKTPIGRSRLSDTCEEILETTLPRLIDMVEALQGDNRRLKQSANSVQLTARNQAAELVTLRRQLAERDAEVERLENEGQECARRLMLAEDARDEERKAAKRNAESSEILREFNKHPHYPDRPCGEPTCDSLRKRYERFLTMSENWCKKHGA